LKELVAHTEEKLNNALAEILLLKGGKDDNPDNVVETNTA